MCEAACSLQQATPASLLVLDELGRGTATHDGQAIAGAVVDYVAATLRCRRVTLPLCRMHACACTGGCLEHTRQAHTMIVRRAAHARGGGVPCGVRCPGVVPQQLPALSLSPAAKLPPPLPGDTTL